MLTKSEYDELRRFREADISFDEADQMAHVRLFVDCEYIQTKECNMQQMPGDAIVIKITGYYCITGKGVEQLEAYESANKENKDTKANCISQNGKNGRQSHWKPIIQIGGALWDLLVRTVFPLILVGIVAGVACAVGGYRFPEVFVRVREFLGW